VGPFRAFLTLASNSDFTMPQLNFLREIDNHGICRGNTGQILAQWWRPVAVIGHGIGGKYIPIIARLAKARRWSKR